MISPVLRKLRLAVPLTAIAIHGIGQAATVPPPTSLPEPAAGASTVTPATPALVPERMLAIRLLAALRLGATTDPAEAERRLSDAGVQPADGWNDEYPVTPSVMGEISSALNTAAQTGRLAMDPVAALKALTDLANELGLPVPMAAPAPSVTGQQTVEVKIYRYVDRSGGVHLTNRLASIPEEFKDAATLVRSTIKPVQPPTPPSALPSSPPPAEMADQSGGGEELPADTDTEPIFENPDGGYYEEEPPPVIYYPPPAAYRDFYAWQEYPFWSSGLYFPGYYVLHNFYGRPRFGPGNLPYGRFGHQSPSGSPPNFPGFQPRRGKPSIPFSSGNPAQSPVVPPGGPFRTIPPGGPFRTIPPGGNFGGIRQPPAYAPYRAPTPNPPSGAFRNRGGFHGPGGSGRHSGGGRHR